jgi:hypothetical protein
MPIVKHYFCLLSFFLLLILSTVMAGLDPAIHAAGGAASGDGSGMDHRVEPGDDEGGGGTAECRDGKRITGSSPVMTVVEGARRSVVTQRGSPGRAR